MPSLYLHIPFCKQRCIYCDFYFVTTHRSTTPFVDALCTEIELQGRTYGHQEVVDTVYFGGGTPSQLTTAEVRRILDALDTHFDASAVSEITFEINPDDVDRAYLDGLREAGINRLSIGIQSFSESDLRWMNRAHTTAQATGVIELARQAGFTNFSIDLIFGLPSQTPDAWARSLRIVQDIAPPHISTYSLTVEPGTVLHKRIQNQVDQHPQEEHVAALYQATMQAFTQNGYEHYEVSSFALEGFRSQHNQVYWAHKNYLGFGPSAHSFWLESPISGTRWKNEGNLKHYIQQLESDQLPSTDVESISSNELLDEYLMLRLRTRDGLNLDHITQSFQIDLLSHKQAAIDRLLQTDHIQFNGPNRLHLTKKGFMVCDAVIGELLL